jgi:predicted TIM-barrel fold metal-dependent hydrolase
VWVSPFWEDNAARATQSIGVERTLFGSDWPHTEGMQTPSDYLDELSSLPAADVRQVMRDNSWELTRPLAG